MTIPPTIAPTVPAETDPELQEPLPTVQSVYRQVEGPFALKG